MYVEIRNSVKLKCYCIEGLVVNSASWNAEHALRDSHVAKQVLTHVERMQVTSSLGHTTVSMMPANTQLDLHLPYTHRVHK